MGYRIHIALLSVCALGFLFPALSHAQCQGGRQGGGGGMSNRFSGGSGQSTTFNRNNQRRQFDMSRIINEQRRQQMQLIIQQQLSQQQFLLRRQQQLEIALRQKQILQQNLLRQQQQNSLQMLLRQQGRPGDLTLIKHQDLPDNEEPIVSRSFQDLIDQMPYMNDITLRQALNHPDAEVRRAANSELARRQQSSTADIPLTPEGLPAPR